MPPEQARGDAAIVDERADVFSLGAILCEILTGRPPYRVEEDSPRDVPPLAALAEARARLAGHADTPELADLARRCLSPDPDARPRTAGELSNEIEIYRSSVEERARTAQISAAEARVRAAEERRARRLTIALAGSILLLAGVGIGARLWVHGHDEARRTHTAQLVGAALDRASLAYGQASSSTDPSHWQAASTEIGRVQSLLEAGESSEDLEARTRTLAERIRSGADAARARADVESSNRELLARISALRAPEVEGTGTIDWARVDSEYAAAFAAHGFTVDDRPATDAARAIRDRGIGVEIAAGLDEWAVARARSGQAKGADQLVQVAVSADPDETRSRLRLALLRGDAQSLLRCSKGTRLDDLPIATLSLLGSSLEKAGEPDEAIRVLRAAQRLHPDDYVTNMLLARLLWDIDYGEAARYYTAASAARPDDVVCVREFGWLLDHYLLDPAHAIDLYRRSLALHPEDPTLHLYLGHALQSSGEFDRATVEYVETLRLEPRRLFSGLKLAECALRKGDLDDAIRRSREFLAVAPSTESAHAYLGEALRRKGELGSAIVELRQATGTDLGAADNGEWLRRALEQAGDDEGALECARRTIAVRPESLVVDHDLGLDLAEFVDLDTAIRECREEVHLHPTSPARHAMLGVLLEAKGLESEALFELGDAEDLGAKVDGWNLPSENRFTAARRLILVEHRCERWVADARRLANVEGRLERVVHGDEKPGDLEEEIEFARLALRRGRYLDAAKLFEEGLRGVRGHDGRRADAASAAAALATDSTPEEGARWRASAAAWMSSDLDDLAPRTATEDPEIRAQVTRVLGQWRHDRRLESVRSAQAIAALPAAEQATWNGLWARLDDLRRATRRAAGALDK
jgi:tetratricopeptide (TPR) repeat protein